MQVIHTIIILSSLESEFCQGIQIQALFFFGRGEGRGYACKTVDIKWMTKNPNQIFIRPFEKHEILCFGAGVHLSVRPSGGNTSFPDNCSCNLDRLKVKLGTVYVERP